MEIEQHKIHIPLLGMSSEHCALLIDNELAKLPGIKSHKVEFANQVAIVEIDPEKIDLPRIILTIRGIGYDVASVRKTIPITGMSCASCASSSESTLGSLNGIVSASVNFANATALVEFFPSEVSLQHMKTALQSAGYDTIIDEGENKDLQAEIRENIYRQLKIKAIGASILALPVMVIAMFFMDMPYGNWIMLVLASPVPFWFGRSFFINAWKQARHGKANMDTLVAISTGIAYIFSVFNTVNPQFWIRRGAQPHVYFEASAVVIAFILLGKMLEENAKANTSFAIKKLMGLQPRTVFRISGDGKETEIPISEVIVGDKLQVKPGDKIAVDGEVFEGSSFIDESMISGEPLAVEKKKGDKVFAGTINQKDSFKFIARKVGGDTMLANIIRMVQEAQGSKAPVQKMVDRIAGIFVPVVLGISVLTFIVWMVFGGQNALTHAMMSSVTVLVIACPCALGLATPTAIMVGVGEGAANGILIKDAESLELAQKVNVVILDKTGTITEGKPEVGDFVFTDLAKNKEELTQLLLAIESQSGHPLAESVAKYLKAANVVPVHLESVANISGRGVRGIYAGAQYFVGNKSLMLENAISITAADMERAEKYESEARTVTFFSNSTDLLAILSITDKIKSSSKSAIENLLKEGIDVYMLTGDNAKTAESVARQVGITHFKSELKPSDKASFVQELQAKGKVVAMVGDGINDSHALAQADVSIAMGKGSDIAMDVAKMTIISSDLKLISKAIHLSKRTVKTIRQNLFWAFIYNLIGIPIAAGILYPVNGFLLNPMMAGAAMALSSVSVVSNSLRVRKRML
jgi:Cu2+-exporting ATPase